MKKFILIIAALFLISSVNQLMAWDTTAAKYMPLRVGNMWVYYGSSGQPVPPYQSYWYGKYRITGTLDTLGKKYYKIQETIVQISGSGYCPVLSRLIRIDSATMNIYSFVVGCSTLNENIIDSLKSKKNDTVSLCSPPPYNKDVCTDTSNINIFGIIYPTKYFNRMAFEGGDSRKYAKSIGIIYNSFTCMMCGCNENLIGCFIDSVLHGDTNMIVGLQNISSEIPGSFSLYQNYPNPFNPSTKIKFAIPAPLNPPKGGTLVRIVIYDVLGREITTLVNEQLNPGTYEVEWPATGVASNFPSGVYFYKLETQDFTETKRMVLIK